MKRRVAYKVANAVAEGRSRHQPHTVARALRVVARDRATGRLDALLVSHRLGTIDLREWLQDNITGPLTAVMGEVRLAFEQLHATFAEVALVFANVGREEEA